MDSSKWFWPERNQTAVYFPSYVRVLRSIEGEIVRFLESRGAEEIILPKLIPPADVQSIARCDPALARVWEHEQFRVTTPDGTLAGYLAHWQCEPFYRLVPVLKKLWPSKDIQYVFDKSGPSHRCEPEHNVYRFDEFWRVEVLFCGELQRIRAERDALLQFVTELACDWSPRLCPRADEDAETGEEVIDVVVRIPSGEIEVCGSHIHFQMFDPATEISLLSGECTACMGISLSRLTMLHMSRNDVEAPQQTPAGDVLKAAPEE